MRLRAYRVASTRRRRITVVVGRFEGSKGDHDHDCHRLILPGIHNRWGVCGLTLVANRGERYSFVVCYRPARVKSLGLVGGSLPSGL